MLAMLQSLICSCYVVLEWCKQKVTRGLPRRTRTAGGFGFKLADEIDRDLWRSTCNMRCPDPGIGIVWPSRVVEEETEVIVAVG